jgi:NADH-quinone oxidoreductase subunit L
MLKLMILAPLAGALLLGLTGKRLGERASGALACLSVAISAIAAFSAFFLRLLPAAPDDDGVRRVTESLGSWISVGAFSADFGLTLDPLSGVMILFVTGVGLLIHIFATGYMHGDAGHARFFACMNLFMFAMLTLVLADNFLLMFVGWEGVGVCSYLLIGHYLTRREAAAAAKKAFIFNRIGDFGVILGVLLIFLKCGSVNFVKVMEWAAAQPVETLGAAAVAAGGLTTISLLLFLGATGKSAQVPLFVWLPDAMAGPTPVSALIHAATMVTAGVYMLTRCNAIFLRSPGALLVVGIVGALTALLAATIALGQSDIKKVLAYSTVSQLGLMFMACGAGAFAAGMFHVTTHAFFKALLFLGAGSVIHGLHEEQDLRRMGGLKKYLPYTRLAMIAGWLAIAGFPFLSGFFSKDEILWRTFTSSALPQPVGKILWLVGVSVSFLTAFYMTRLMTMTFEGGERFQPADKRATAVKPHESPAVMLVPLIILAALSIGGGLLGVPETLGGGNRFEHFLEPILKTENLGATVAETATNHSLELLLMAFSALVALAGLGVGWAFFRKNPLWSAPKILQDKYLVDEAYDAAIARPVEILAREGLAKFADRLLIDGAVVGLARLAAVVGDGLRVAQSGFARGYAAFIFIGALLLIGYFFVA